MQNEGNNKNNPFESKESTENPFQMQEATEEYVSGRYKDPNNEHLYHALRKMEISKTKFLWIPASIYPNQDNATSKVHTLKKSIRQNYPALSEIDFGVKTIKDAEKKYLGLRVFRVS